MTDPTLASPARPSPLAQAVRFDFGRKLAHAPDRLRAATRHDLAGALSTVYLDVNTDVCNHACGFCDGFHRPLIEASFSEERLLRMVEEMEELGVMAVVLAGDRGEPMMHPAMPALLQRFAESDIELGMYTNGTVLPPRLVPLLSAFTWLRLSADSAKAATHRAIHVYQGRRDDFAVLLENIRTASQIVPDVGASFILDPLNVAEIEEGADVLLGAGAGFVEYKPKYLPDYTVDSAWLLEHRDLIAGQIARARGRWGERIVVNNQVSALLEGTEAPSLTVPSRPCLTSALRMVVSTHGCYPCTPYRGEAERRFGDPLTQSLPQILATAERQALIAAPCSRRCAYHEQNDLLLQIAEHGGELPSPDSPPGPQDAFL